MKTLSRVRRACPLQNSPIFWNWPPKKISVQQKPVAFRKSQKSDKSLSPTVQVTNNTEPGL